MNARRRRLCGPGCVLLWLLLCLAITAPVRVHAQSTFLAWTPGDAAVENMTAVGELVAVNVERGLLLLADEDGTERLFACDELTEVDTLYAGVAALAGHPGLWLRVHYRAEGLYAIAERIEVTDGELTVDRVTSRATSHPHSSVALER